ncbi:MAG: hypothetical protein HY543_08225 [Deltaproteobacteria bacterium]|nr:hypothetical protein [Deltaproteobacteria bacterium]
MAAIGEPSRSDLYTLKAQTFLGSDDFVETVPDRSDPERVSYHISLAEITEAVCEDLRVKKGELKGRERARKPAEARHLIGYVARELAGFSHGEVAKTFGREAISFSTGVRRMARRVSEHHPFRKRVDALADRLIQGKRRKIY